MKAFSIVFATDSYDICPVMNHVKLDIGTQLAQGVRSAILQSNHMYYKDSRVYMFFFIYDRNVHSSKID